MRRRFSRGRRRRSRSRSRRRRTRGTRPIRVGMRF